MATHRTTNQIQLLAEFSDGQEKSIVLKLPAHVMEGLSLDGKTVAAKHLIGVLMLMERQAQLQQQDDMTMNKCIDLLDAAYHPQRAANHN